MTKIWYDRAWSEYANWQTRDKKTIKRINELLKSIDRNGYNCIGKPEPLKDNLTGLWSRRIDQTNRLVYMVTDEQIEIYQCKGHYDD